MSNTLRNTIILFVLLIIMITSIVLIRNNLNKKTAILDKQNKDTAQKIAVLEEQISKIDSLKAEYEYQKLLYAQQSKLIVGADTPNKSYQYLLQVLGWMKSYIPFDFAVTDAQKKDASYNEYVISGRTHYHDVVRLTKHLEYQRAVLTIEELSIGADAIPNSDSVSFSMIFRTHYQPDGPDLNSLEKKKIESPYLGYYLFKPRYYEALPNIQIDPNLPNIDTSKLIGVTATKVFLKDPQGVIRILGLGDKVAWGYLFGIDLSAGRAIFKLNRYGIDETHSLQTTAQ